MHQLLYIVWNVLAFAGAIFLLYIMANLLLLFIGKLGYWIGGAR